MMTTTDPRVVAYLHRLDEAAAGLRAERRVELVAEIRDHIVTRLSDPGPAAGGMDPVETTLARLGEPEEIVAAAADDVAAMEPAATSVGRPRSSGGLEVAALVLLLLGGFVFVVGWIIGVVLLWMSPRWTVRQKLLGTLVWPGGLATPVLFGGLIAVRTGAGCTSVPVNSGIVEQCSARSDPLGIALLVLSILAPLVVVAYLGIRSRRQAVD